LLGGLIGAAEMEHPSELYDFGKLLADLDGLDLWLKEMGLANPDRVRKYRRNLRRMTWLISRASATTASRRGSTCRRRKTWLSAAFSCGDQLRIGSMDTQ
jgi:hypothetical protein